MKGIESDTIGGSIPDTDVPEYARLLASSLAKKEGLQALIERRIMSVVPEKRGEVFLLLAHSKGLTNETFAMRHKELLAK